MSDEWRVEVDLDDEQHGYSLGERLRSLPLDEQAKERLGGRAIVTRDGARMFVYTSSEETAAEAEKAVRELLDEDELSARVAVTRFHPLEGVWKDASEPLPASEEEQRAEYERKEAAGLREAAEHGEYPWEVRLDFSSLEDAVAAEQRLADQDLPVHRRWRHVLVGAPTEEAANELEDRLRSALPDAVQVTIEAHDVRYPVFMLLGSSY
jgi:hypothetical protein